MRIPVETTFYEAYDDTPACWYVSFAYPYPKPDGVRGYPLGRSSSKDGALADLVLRTNAESGLTLKVEDCVIVREG